MHSSIFVYGTLKRGQCRASMWPAEPTLVRPAWVRGRLFGRDDYPALLPGFDRVLGELWEFTLEDLPCVYKKLDEIEGTGQPGMPDHYIRVQVPVFEVDKSESIGLASVYHYARNPDCDGFEPIRSSDGAMVQWFGL